MTTQEAIRWYESKLFVNERFRLLGTQNEAAKLALAALRAQEERECNDPLTLEELREMDGEPVWVERPDGYKSYNGWALVDVSWRAQGVIYLVCANGSTTLCVSLLHSGGKVYRHKPEPPEEGESNGTTDSKA